MQLVPLVECQKVENVYLPYHSFLEVCLDSHEVGDKMFLCRLSGEMHPRKLMRRHVAGHIHNEDLDIVCGFCGFKDSSIDLDRGSGRGKTATVVPRSNCKYASKFSLKRAVKPT